MRIFKMLTQNDLALIRGGKTQPIFRFQVEPTPGGSGAWMDYTVGLIPDHHGGYIVPTPVPPQISM